MGMHRKIESSNGQSGSASAFCGETHPVDEHAATAHHGEDEIELTEARSRLDQGQLLQMVKLKISETCQPY